MVRKYGGSATMTLTHDHAGNLTDDGIFLYTYDAWNRLVAVRSRYTSGTTQVTFVTNAYDGLFRRITKAVTGSGYGVVSGSDDLDGDGTPDAAGIQAGDRVEHYYYAGWSIVEERNGSNQVTAQTVWGTQYIDEPVSRDRNTNPGTNDDCLDATSARYAYHQDANFRVVALTDENGAVVERYDYTAYGEPTVTCGAGISPANETGNVLLTSRVGNPFMHQGLFRDDESGTYQNRFRHLHSRTGRFMQRDPLSYALGPNLYIYLDSTPLRELDPKGTSPVCCTAAPGLFGWVDCPCPANTRVGKAKCCTSANNGSVPLRSGGTLGPGNIWTPAPDVNCGPLPPKLEAKVNPHFKTKKPNVPPPPPAQPWRVCVQTCLGNMGCTFGAGVSGASLRLLNVLVMGEDVVAGSMSSIIGTWCAAALIGCMAGC